MIEVRLALPVRSPSPLSVPCTWRAPAAHGGHRVGDRAAGVVVAVDADRHVAADVGVDLAHDLLDLVRQRAAVGVAQHDVAWRP